MYSEFKSLSFMGVSDSQMFLSEKDLNAMEFNFLVRPTVPPEDHHGIHKKPPEVKEEEEEENKCKISVSCLELKIPSVGKFRDVEDDDDGFKTPTSLGHKIPAILQCPPAPRKPKTIPLMTKRKAARQRILLDLSNDIESLFPTALLVDLSGKFKKIRQEDR